ncbi:MAG TPA: Uma2 family endonuclease [Ktedonobacterales bacterium]
MAAQPRLITAEEFAALPRAGLRLELIRGEIIAMPPAFVDHGGVAGKLHILLGRYVLDHHLGRVYSAETGFLITRNPDSILAPDIAFISSERLTPELTAPRWGVLVPDLVVEVVSSGDRPTRVAEKTPLWLDAGVRLLWIVYPPRQSIEVHRSGQVPITLTSNDTLAGEDVVPGFSVPIIEIFT